MYKNFACIQIYFMRDENSRQRAFIMDDSWNDNDNEIMTSLLTIHLTTICSKKSSRQYTDDLDYLRVY